MKNIVLLLTLFFVSNVMAVCSSPLSRNNFANREVLTSTRLNLELNTIYSRANELPGDCITDETVTSAKIVDGTISSSDVASNFYGGIAPKFYYTLLQAGGHFSPGNPYASTYVMSSGGIMSSGQFGVASSIDYGGVVIYIDPSDFPSINGKTAKLRISTEYLGNDTAPTVNFTVGLHPITRPGTSGSNTQVFVTVGAAVSNSTYVFTAPASDAMSRGVSQEFSVPSAGYYVLGVSLSGTGALNSQAFFSSRLQLTYSN